MQKRWRRLLQKLRLVGGGGGSSARRKYRDGPTAATWHDHGGSAPHTVCPVVSRPRSGKANSTDAAENAGGRRLIRNVYHNQIPANTLTGGDTNTNRHVAPTSETAKDEMERKIHNVHKEGPGVNFRGPQYFLDDGRTGVGGVQMQPPYLHRGLRRRPIAHTYTRPLVGMEVLVKTLTGRTITLAVNPWYTVHTVKALLQEQFGIPVREQRLIFDRHQLDDGRTLADYNVKDGSTFYFVVTLASPSPVRYRRPTLIRFSCKDRLGNVRPIEAMSCDTIWKVKAKIQEKVGIPADWQRFIYQGRRLEDWCTLSDCGIRNQSEIDLLEGLRGGGGPTGEGSGEQRRTSGSHQGPDGSAVPPPSVPTTLSSLSDRAGWRHQLVLELQRPSIEEDAINTSCDVLSQLEEDQDTAVLASEAVVVVSRDHGSLQVSMAEERGSEEGEDAASNPRRQEQEDEDEASDQLFPLEPAVAMSHGSLQASVLAMAADVELFSVSLDVAISPADAVVAHAIFPFLAVVLLKKTFLPLIYWVLLFLLQIRRPLQLLLNRGAQELRNLLPARWRSFLQEPATKAWGFVAQVLKLLLLLLLYMFAPHWLNLKLKFKPDLSKVSSAWEWSRKRALGWLRREPQQHQHSDSRQLPTVTAASPVGLAPARPLPESSILYGSCWEYLFHPPPSIGVVGDLHDF